MRSSYIENNYDIIFRSLILAKRPKVVVECGVLDGYSLIAMAEGIKFNREKFRLEGHIYAYDLWEDYEYKHGHRDDVIERLKERKLDDFVTLVKVDAFEVTKILNDNTVDFLHMDISNNGDTLLKTLDCWGSIVKSDGMIAFEGGSEERDDVDWMIKYKFKSIREALCDPYVMGLWEYQILEPFPSLTLLWHRNK